MRKIFLIFSYFFFHTIVIADPTFVTFHEVRESRHALGITFNNDGTKMYIIASTNTGGSGVNNTSSDFLAEYNLSAPYSLVNAQASASVKENNVRWKCGNGHSLINPAGVHFHPEGTLVFVTDGTGNTQHDACHISLTTPYDVDTLTETTPTADNGFRLDSGDTDVSPSVDNDAYGIDFNLDGSKVFIVGEDENKIFEFTLPNKWDFKDAEYSGNFFDTSTQMTVAGNLRFSKDGKQMFVNDQIDDKIFQWSLSEAFNLNSTSTFRGSFSIREQYQSIAGDDADELTGILEGLEFNNDGSKFFVVTGPRANTADSHFVLEYNLDCPYGIVYCESPVSGSDKDLIGTIEAYGEQSKRIVINNIYPVMHRLEWLRRHRKEDNLSNQNIKFNFSNEMFSSLVKAIPATTKEKFIPEKLPRDWFVWSEGLVSIGETEATVSSSKKETNTSNITIGADKKVSENKMYGFALQFGRDSADVGSSQALLETDNYSVAFYGTIPNKNEKFLDGVIGISTLNIEHLRKKNSIELTGQRNGKQFFSSLKYNKLIHQKDIDINPTARIDLGFTELSSFSESGSNDALIYEKYEIPTGKASLGMSLNKTQNLNNDKLLKSNILLEYIGDFSPSTDTSVSYVTDPSTIYSISVGNQSTHNYVAGLGFDLSTDSGWSAIINYERHSASGTGHTDNLYFTAGYVPRKNTEYALSINGSENIKTVLNVVKNVRDFNLKFNIDTDLLYVNRSHNANISINKVY